MSEKSYDPRMHSAEHILNQTMIRLFNCGRSFNSHIEKKKSKCDYRINNKLSDEDLIRIESQVNEIIHLKLNVTEDFVKKSEAANYLDLTKLPASAPEYIRVIKIGQYDACACIGPHVMNTSEIGTFKIISTDFVNGIVRIRYKLEAN